MESEEDVIMVASGREEKVYPTDFISCGTFLAFHGGNVNRISSDPEDLAGLIPMVCILWNLV